MTDYTALIAKWGTLAPDTTSNKLTAINAITVTGAVPSTIYINGSDFLNCINYGEFKVLTPSQQANILALCDVVGPVLGGSANTTHILVGMILDLFPVAGPTIAALTALSKAVVQPWWQANGYNAAITGQDLVNAGLQLAVPVTPLG